MTDNRDYCEEAMRIIDNDTLLLPERVHLVALHEFCNLAIRRWEKRVICLLKKLDAEHSHTAGTCETCDWLQEEPEWQEIMEARRQH